MTMELMDPKQLSQTARIEPIDISQIPADWFLWSISDFRKKIIFKGDVHEHLCWTCQLQHVNGGRMSIAEDPTPQGAINRCVDKVKAFSGI